MAGRQAAPRGCQVSIGTKLKSSLPSQLATSSLQNIFFNAICINSHQQGTAMLCQAGNAAVTANSSLTTPPAKTVSS
jgi:hypothetical protein